MLYFIEEDFEKMIIIWFFLVCMPGFSGINCTEQCSYSAYGIRCKGYCDCKEDMCDMSIGCTTPTPGKFQHSTPPLFAPNNGNKMQYSIRDVN